MSGEGNAPRPLQIKGASRQRELVASVSAWATRGLSRTQARRLARTLDAQVNIPPLDDDEFRQAFNEAWSMAAEVSEQDYFQDLEDVAPRQPEFLVDPFIPRGALTILDGHPGQGKSLVTTHLATAITRGRKFAERYLVPRGRVLFMAPEDDADRVLRPRLEAQGANIAKIRFMKHPHCLDEFGRSLLRKELVDHRPQLVVIDPLPPFVSPDTNTYKATDVRSFMQPLALLAREMDIAVLLVRHLRKGGSETAIEAGQGSMDFIAAVRSGLMVFGHPADPGTKVLAHAKANWSASGPSLTFEIATNTGSRVPSINWLAQLDETADQLMQGATKQKVEEAAAAKIVELLATGPMKASDAKEYLLRAGFSARTIDRAKVLAKVKAGHGPGAQWSLR